MDSVTQFLHFPIQDPTWVFFLVLLIILFAPLIFGKLRIPHIIGMILAGVLIGEHGLGLLERDDSFRLFGQVGILYIMFLAGLEMDLVGFKHNLSRGISFGVLTAAIPFGAGFVAGYFLLGYTISASLLLSCIFASHTIVAYPIVARYGLTKHPAVTVSIAATMIALLSALLMLAVISGRYRGGSGTWYWILFAAKCIAYFAGLFFIFPIIIRAFFKKYTDRVLQFIFVLAMVFLSAALAELCGIEGLLGAFLSGLIFNRFIPQASSLMNRIEFVGNSLFIPYFLIGVGMLVNLKPIFTEMNAIEVVVIMVVVSTLSKLLASFLTRKMFRFNHAQGLMMFGLTEAHAAGAIAMVMVGTKLEIMPGVPLMNNAVLDGVVVMILISCIISSIATDQAARKLKLEADSEETLNDRQKGDDEKILVLVNRPEKLRNITQTAIMMRNQKLNRGLICLNVVNDADETEFSQRQSHELLGMAEEICVAADVPVQTQSRLAVNLINGVVHSLRENDASELIVGLHHKDKKDESLFGNFVGGLIQAMSRQLIIAGIQQPVNTIRKIVVAVPDRAEYEAGFYRWIERIARFTAEIGCRIEFHSTEATGRLIYQYVHTNHKSIRAEYKLMESWNELQQMKDDIHSDHLLVVVAARQGGISYQRAFNKLPRMLKDNFSHCNLMVVYPDQYEGNNEPYTFSEPHGGQFEMSRTSAWLSKWISKIG